MEGGVIKLKMELYLRVVFYFLVFFYRMLIEWKEKWIYGGIS